MEVILLERVPKLGQMGQTVRVRDGYARNYLLAQGKALRATADNKSRFEQQRAQLEARNLERRKEAEEVNAKLDGESFVLIRSAGESGVLYGSVATRDLADVITGAGFTVSRQQIQLSQPIKTLGLHKVAILLHPEVEAKVTVNVARSPDEAERQARGEDVFAREELDLDELGLEVGAALEEYERPGRGGSDEDAPQTGEEA
ncbi:50S ribosomal protein L9 [Salinarimonas sp. NSM]|uniref:50S ribosomal protein L9 n=1 Tax=Salinarimonas sp. NSM TaxID=3458003 RepID=UPI0040371C31